MNRIQLNFKTNQNCNSTNVTGTQQTEVRSSSLPSLLLFCNLFGHLYVEVIVFSESA